jgi:hypothetical protein
MTKNGNLEAPFPKQGKLERETKTQRKEKRYSFYVILVFGVQHTSVI